MYLGQCLGRNKLKKLIKNFLRNSLFRFVLIRALNSTRLFHQLTVILILSVRLIFFRKGLWHKLKNYRVSLIEANEIKRLQKSQNTLVLQYNFQSAPATYGDLFIFIMLCRYFYLKNQNLKIYITNTQSHSKLISEFKPFIAKIFPANLVVISDFAIEVKENEAFQILAPSRIRSNSAHHHFFNLLNRLMTNETSDFVEKFLLKASDFSNSATPDCGSYIAVHCRYISPTSKYFISESFRNTNEKQFVKLINFLSNTFPDIQILILTDKMGQDYFKLISDRYSLKCVFPSNKNKNYFSDAKLVANAKFYFQLNGGGLCSAAWFSNVDYLIFVKAVANEVQFSLNYLTSWATKKQIFRQISLNEEFYSFIKLYKSDKFFKVSE